MAQDFSALKKNRKSEFDKLNTELAKITTPQANNQSDNRFWQPEVDKVGNGSATIRFLPAPKGEDMPFVRLWDHAFKGPGGWYIENSLTTLGQPDPVSEYNSELWATGLESNKKIVRDQKRRLIYISNILVVKDPTRPENNGKVFLFKYGKKIFEKLNDLMNPEFDDETPVNPFDFWEGADFRLKIRKVEGYRNYDKSEFDKPSAVSTDDDELAAIWNKEYSLQEFVDPKNFKSYDELKARLYRVLALDGKGTVAPKAAVGTPPWDEDAETKPAPAIKSKAPVPTIDEDDDEETAAYFRKLAASDDE